MNKMVLVPYEKYEKMVLAMCHNKEKLKTDEYIGQPKDHLTDSHPKEDLPKEDLPEEDLPKEDHPEEADKLMEKPNQPLAILEKPIRKKPKVRSENFKPPGLPVFKLTKKWIHI
jgi:hypothetical protein